MSAADYIDVSSTGRSVDGMLTFFEDPAIDKLFGVVLALSRENYVLADRVRVLEHLLDAKGVLSRSELDAFAPDAAAEPEFHNAREQYFERLLEPLTADDTAGPNLEEQP